MNRVIGYDIEFLDIVCDIIASPIDRCLRSKKKIVTQVLGDKFNATGYVLKTNAHRAKGLHFLSGGDITPGRLRSFGVSCNASGGGALLQQEVAPPLLLRKRRFNTRVFILVASFRPFMAFSKVAFAMLAPVPPAQGSRFGATHGRCSRSLCSFRAYDR